MYKQQVETSHSAGTKFLLSMAEAGDELSLTFLFLFLFFKLLGKAKEKKRISTHCQLRSFYVLILWDLLSDHTCFLAALHVSLHPTTGIWATLHASCCVNCGWLPLCQLLVSSLLHLVLAAYPPVFWLCITSKCQLVGVLCWKSSFSSSSRDTSE